MSLLSARCGTICRCQEKLQVPKSFWDDVFFRMEARHQGRLPQALPEMGERHHNILTQILPELQGLDGHACKREVVEAIERTLPAEIDLSAEELREQMLEEAVRWLVRWAITNRDAARLALEALLGRVITRILSTLVPRSVLAGDQLAAIAAEHVARRMIGEKKETSENDPVLARDAMVEARLVAAQLALDLTSAQDELQALRSNGYFPALLEHVLRHVTAWRATGYMSSGMGEKNASAPELREEVSDHRTAAQMVVDEAALWLECSGVPPSKAKATDLDLIMRPVAHRKVIATLRRADDDADVASVTNEAMRQFLGQWPEESKKLGSSASRLLKTIADRRAKDWIRKMAGDPVLPPPAEDAGEGSRPSDPLDDQETREELLRVLEECLQEVDLSDQMREWIDQHYHGEATWKEIARSAGMNADAVRQSVKTAREKLAKCIERKTPDLPRRKK